MYSDRLNIAYMRVAHRTNDETEITKQKKRITTYRQQHPELPSHFEEIIDNGYSGFDDDAPGIQRILKLIKENKIAFLIVSDLSRLTRDPHKANIFMEQLFPSHNVNFIIIDTESNDSE